MELVDQLCLVDRLCYFKYYGDNSGHYPILKWRLNATKNALQSQFSKSKFNSKIKHVVD